MSRPRYLLGVDLGAGSLKATVLATDGVIAGEASAPIATQTPCPGHAEQDPAGWYLALTKAVPAAIAAASIEPTDVAGIGISAGAHIAVLADEHDRPLRPAILWSDQRAAAEAAELDSRAGERIVASSMNRANPTWTLPQLLWLQRHEPEVVRRTHRLYLAKDWLRSRLTGDWHSDFSDAVGALMADVDSGGWSRELCELVDWPIETLPPLVEPRAVVGEVGARAAAECGLAAGTPVVCASNDTTVEFFGAGAVRPGQGAIKLATAGVLFLCSDGPRINPPVSCYPHILPGLCYTASGTNSCASAHRWLRDRLFPGDSFESMDALAAGIAPGADGLLFHPYLIGERAPYWDPRLRARFVGLTMGHDRGHMVRALYEGIALSIRDLRDSSPDRTARFDEIRLLGGGARSATWRQILADVMGVEMVRPACGDASFGAALVAGLGVGLFANPDEALSRCVRVLDRTAPDPARHARYDRLFAIYKDTQSALADIDHRLHDFAAG